MKRTVACFIGMVLLVAAGAHAAPVLVGFPPPGGVTVASGGSTSGTGNGEITTLGSIGHTFTYTSLNPIAGGYTDLWWGPTSLLGPLSSISGPGTSQALTLQSITGNKAIFAGAAPWT